MVVTDELMPDDNVVATAAPENECRELDMIGS